MKAVIKNIITFALFTVLIMAIGLLASCQPTPETPIVIQKNELENIIEAGEPVSDTEIQNENEESQNIVVHEGLANMILEQHWTSEVSNKNNIELIIDADIYIPDVENYITYKVSPISKIPETTFVNLLSEILQDSPILEDSYMTKEELENALLIAQEYKFNLESDKEKELFESEIESYSEYKSRKLIEIDNIIQYYNEKLEAEDYSENVEVPINYEFLTEGVFYGKVDLDHDYYATLEINKGNTVFFSNLQANANNEMLGYDSVLNMITGFCERSQLKDYNISQIQDKNSMDLSVRDDFISDYEIVLNRYVNGISIPKETYFWDRMNSEIYFMNQEILDDEEFTITIKGDRIDSLVWSGYYDIDYKSGIIVDIIPIEEIKGIIETNVKNVYSYSIKEGVNARCTITKTELIMARVPMLNNLEEQWLIPAWNVYGSIEYDYNDGRGYTDKVSDTLLLTINALDGSLN